MLEQGKQLMLGLQPTEPYAPRYFVPHTGVAPALKTFRAMCTRFLDDTACSEVLYVFGRSGTGKEHLFRVLAKELEEFGLTTDQAQLVKLSDKEQLRVEGFAESFVARAEQLRSRGGVLVVIAPDSPGAMTDNPHLLSRFKMGSVIELSFPSEEELPALIASLLERRNLKLSPRSVDYLLRRLPRDPLSFDHIFAKINELSFSQSRPAHLSVVKAAVGSDLERSR